MISLIVAQVTAVQSQSKGLSKQISVQVLVCRSFIIFSLPTHSPTMADSSCVEKIITMTHHVGLSLVNQYVVGISWIETVLHRWCSCDEPGGVALPLVLNCSSWAVNETLKYRPAAVSYCCFGQNLH